MIALFNRQRRRFSRSTRPRRKCVAPFGITPERLEQRIALDAAGGRTLLEQTRTIMMDQPMGPHPVVMTMEQVAGNDVNSFVISSVPEGSVVEKWDVATEKWVDVSSKPTSSNPQELLRLLGNRLIQQGDKLQWRPKAASEGSTQQAFQIINWDLDRSAAEDAQQVDALPGWDNPSLTRAASADRFIITADTTISLLRQDAKSEQVRFGMERQEDGGELILMPFNPANRDSLNLVKITANQWPSTEGVPQGGMQETAIAAGTYIPVAIDASGRRLSLESLFVLGNSATALFAGGVEAVYAVGGSGVLANAVNFGSQVTVTATVHRLSAYNNGIALYEADALTGAVAGLLPGSTGYLAAALNAAKRAGTVYSAFELPEYGGTSSLSLTFDPAKNYGFLLIVNGDENNLYSSYSVANPNESVQITSFTTPDGALTLGFEDLLTSGISDKDFNDIILSIPTVAAAGGVSAVNYRIGSLFPTKADGSPNLVLSSDLELRTINGESHVVKRAAQGTLETPMTLSSDPVTIPGIDRFLRNWFIPQITAINDPQSLFNVYRDKVLSQWTGTPRNNSIEDLLKIGYNGPGHDQSTNSDAFWMDNGEDGEQLFDDVSDLQNYDPSGLWSSYDGSTTVHSHFAIEALLENLEALTNPTGNPNPDLWYPSMLYSFGLPGEGTSVPGPVLMMQSGDTLKLHFSNDIRIDGLTDEQNQNASLVRNSTYGNSAGDGLGAVNSTNFHLHGAHTNPTGFGDNVVARYTTGQEWTTEMTLPEEYGQGMNWYHPHYHPSVNQMVYGGMSGAFQVGDPLSRVPLFKDVPRNVAVLKTMQVGIKPDGALRLDGFDNLGGVVNRMTMVTVNGEFQPTAQAGQGGWQALTLSNQSNQAFYNISLIHTDTAGNRSTLPLYIYGEDGNQYPQIRAATEGIFGATGGKVPTAYTQAENLISLPPAKRVDLLVYLPEGSTEIASTYSFTEDGITYSVTNSGGYPDLTSENTGTGRNTGAGPLAMFEVTAGSPMPSTETLDQFIAEANSGIVVQEILPTTPQGDYDPAKVFSVDLFAESPDGSDLWQPIRQRMFNWTKGTLVGPPSEYDAATVALLEQYSTENGGASYTPYTALPVGQPGVDTWLGYNNPFLINDHVFPNGSLTIAQMGTMEEWVNRNWSIGSPTKYIGHPFHIHINDYQVEDSDSELPNKRNLEDTTALNSSGYHYYDANLGQIVEMDPLRGSFYSIDEALDPNSVKNMVTFGANDQTIRMAFQNFTGTYVFHCHILPHEDAGMMQVITVVENTDSSWLVAAEGFNQTQNGVLLTQAQTYQPVEILASAPSDQTWQRAQSGSLSSDFVQDVALASGGGSEAGTVQIFDGAALQLGVTDRTAVLTPYVDSTLAPWVFIEDFSGDGQRDLLTAGFDSTQTVSLDLQDLEIKAFLPGATPGSWTEQFQFDPFDTISLSSPNGVAPRADLQANQLSVAMSDMNLDNFQDIVIAYAVTGGLRLVVLDGAAMSLSFQTGQMEGGYFPNSNVLADSLLLDASLSDLSQLVITSGFNSYAQSALENVVLTTTSSAGTQQFTLQLQAGHFIATNIPGTETMASHTAGMSSHGMTGQSMDDRIVNLRHDAMPLTLVDEWQLSDGIDAVTPVISAGLGHGGTVVDGHAVVAQGNTVNGNAANTDVLFNTTQQLVIPLEGLTQITVDDLAGIAGSTGSSTFSADEVRERYQLTAMTYLAYTGQLLWPSALATQAAEILGSGMEASALVSNLLDSPFFSGEVSAHYGGALTSLSTESIVQTAFNTLFNRSATAAELAEWTAKVNSGLDRTLLPQSILQSTSGSDTYRVAALSGISQWTALQWGTTAEISGSFGQGLSGDIPLATALDVTAGDLGSFGTWVEAQQGFDSYANEALSNLIGTAVSKGGFF